MCHYFFNNSLELKTVIFCPFLFNLSLGRKEQKNGYPAPFIVANFCNDFPLAVVDRSVIDDL